MKKFLALFAAVVVMTACTKKEEAPVEAEAPAVEAPAAEAPAAEAPAADASSSEAAK